MKSSRGSSPSIRLWSSAIAASTLCLLAAPSYGGTAIFADPVGPGTGISYEWTVGLGASDTIDFSRWVGAWSWEDDDLTAAAGIPTGWTHASDFVALTLTEPTTFTIHIERFTTPKPTGGTASIANMNPSFTLWSGWDNTGGESHEYNNDRKISWADVTYVGHVKNGTEAMVEASYLLPAGNYTIAIGSNAPAIDAEVQGYKATFTTSVPEPASCAFVAAGAVALASMRRRKDAHVSI